MLNSPASGRCAGSGCAAPRSPAQRTQLARRLELIVDARHERAERGIRTERDLTRNRLMSTSASEYRWTCRERLAFACSGEA